ncbi:MAG: response regulator transcription factor [Bacteroidota bacterium]|jgi:two-component system copper resistance phosphate regulon response regulator CusR
MKILVVEDEPKTLSTLRKGLEESGFSVDTCNDGSSATQMVLDHNYHVIVSDILMPETNGFEFCKTIRENGVQVPVIFLTALGMIEDKLKGFEIGADDYLVKPFDFKELVARIHNANKKYRRFEEDAHFLTYGDLSLELFSREVYRCGQKIDLTTKEFSLLELLIKKQGKILSRKEIIEKIWNISFDTGTNIVEVYVNYLRKKIDKGFEQKLIQTKVGKGYYLAEM